MRTIFILSLLVLTGCQSWKFYVPQDKQTRKQHSLDFRMGRSFAGGDAICTEVNLINWNSQAIKVPLEALVMKSNNERLPLISAKDVIANKTFLQGLTTYYGQAKPKATAPAMVKRIYGVSEFNLQPKDTRQIKLLCYRTAKDQKGPFALQLTGLLVQGKKVSMKPFLLKEFKRTKKNASAPQ